MKIIIKGSRKEITDFMTKSQNRLQFFHNTTICKKEIGQATIQGSRGDNHQGL